MIAIGGYLIDGVASERESLSATATEYPVERGGTITDHVVNDQPVLDLEFVVTDTPIGAMAAVREAGVVPSSEARQVLTALRATRKPFTVEVGGRSYPSMIFTSLEFPRDKDTGDCLRGTGTVKHIEIVDVRRVSVALQQRRAGRRVARAVPGKTQWVCPLGTPIAKSDTENLAHGCRAVITRTFGDQSYLAFADTGAALNDAQISLLGTQQFNATNGTRLPEVAIWNPVGQTWVTPREGAEVSKFPDRESTLRLMTGVPSDYEPPARPEDLSPQSSGEDYYRNPFPGRGD